MDVDHSAPVEGITTQPVSAYNVNPLLCLLQGIIALFSLKRGRWQMQDIQVLCSSIGTNPILPLVVSDIVRQQCKH